MTPIKNNIVNIESLLNHNIEYPTTVAKIAYPNAHHIMKLAPCAGDTSKL